MEAWTSLLSHVRKALQSQASGGWAAGQHSVWVAWVDQPESKRKNILKQLCSDWRSQAAFTVYLMPGGWTKVTRQSNICRAEETWWSSEQQISCHQVRNCCGLGLWGMTPADTRYVSMIANIWAVRLMEYLGLYQLKSGCLYIILPTNLAIAIYKTAGKNGFVQQTHWGPQSFWWPCLWENVEQHQSGWCSERKRDMVCCSNPAGGEPQIWDREIRWQTLHKVPSPSMHVSESVQRLLLVWLESPGVRGLSTCAV